MNHPGVLVDCPGLNFPGGRILNQTTQSPGVRVSLGHSQNPEHCVPRRSLSGHLAGLIDHVEIRQIVVGHFYNGL
jgi:hypothetical protein